MKRLIKICSLLLVLVMSLAFFGCSNSGKKDNDDKECSSHKYRAGICKNCSHDIFDDLEDLKLSSVSEEDFAEFVDEVANNSTDGEISLEKYGAEIDFKQLDRFYSGVDYNEITKFWYEADVKVQFDNGIYMAELDVKVSPYSSEDENASKFDITHKAYVVDKIIYSQQPNKLNGLGEIADCSNDTYNTIVDILRKASCLEIENSAKSWDIVSVNLPVAYTELFLPLQANYFQSKVGNYFVVKVTFNNTYMGAFDFTYVYDEQYDLVGFKAISKSGEDFYMSMKPLDGKVEIPETIND